MGFAASAWELLARASTPTEGLEAVVAAIATEVGASRVAVGSIDTVDAATSTLRWWAAKGPRATSLPLLVIMTAAELDRLRAHLARHPLTRRSSADVPRALFPIVPSDARGRLLVASIPMPEHPTSLALAVAELGGDGSTTDPLEAALPVLSVALARLRTAATTTTTLAAVAPRDAGGVTRDRDGLSDTIIGANGGLRHVMRRLAQVSRSDVPVLILGETGSGKEVIARALHGRSARAGAAFIRVNCGAIPSELIDSELFGHERGAFTGASAQRRGWFEQADGGTLFLDEIGELSLPAQVRLLRILQEGTFQRVGGERTIEVDVRVVAATHRDLGAMIESGRFREDLWYRLDVFPIRLPPLREHPEDIPAMAEHFARVAAARFGVATRSPTEDDLARLMRYGWPGNVRELGAVIDRAVLLGDGERLEVATALGDVPLRERRPVAAPATIAPVPVAAPAATGVTGGASGFARLDDLLRDHIAAVLRACAGRVEGPRGAARVLGVNPHTLRGKMRRLGIAWRDFRE